MDVEMTDHLKEIYGTEWPWRAIRKAARNFWGSGSIIS